MNSFDIQSAPADQSIVFSLAEFFYSIVLVDELELEEEGGTGTGISVTVTGTGTGRGAIQSNLCFK